MAFLMLFQFKKFLTYFSLLIKSMLNFSDIYECISNPCRTNAECKDVINSCTCMCKEGFTGDGISCIGNFHDKWGFLREQH